jgi:flagellar assembly protein FliH
MDSDPLLLAVALARARDKLIGKEAHAEAAAAEVPTASRDEANHSVDPDAPSVPVAEGAARPDPVALLEQIEARRLQVLEQAYGEGYAAGEEAGRDEARHAYDKEIGALRELAASMSPAFDVFLSDAEDLLVEIAFEAVCKIMGRALCERAGVSAMVRQVIEQVREREQLIVRLAPADFALLTGPDAPGLEAEIANAQLTPDERVARGGCLIDSPSGTLDGRLETQLQRLREVLIAARAVNAEGAL